MRAQKLSGVLAAAVVVLAGAAASSARADETTQGYGPLRQNWDAAEPGLTTLTVGDSTFGRRWTSTLPGTTASTPNQLYAQPLVVHDLGSAQPAGAVIVATEDDVVAALNPTSGTVEWSRSLGPGWVPTPTCGDLAPHVGITSTPVYDPSSHTVYVIAKADDGPDTAHPSIKVHALDAATGKERPNWPLTVAGRSTNGGRTFDAATSNQRPGLLLSHGALYFGMASHCDHGPFVGFVGRVAVSGTKPALSLWTTDEDDVNGQAGIWQSGGAIMTDGDDPDGQPRIFIATGNGLGTPAPVGPGTSPPEAMSESVIRLHVATDGTMTAADFFSPTDNLKLDQDDADLGSGAPVALPDSYGSGTHPHLLVIVGKDGVVRLLDRDDLGGVGQGAGGTDDVVDSIQTGGVWGHAAVFDGGPARRYLYLAPSGGPMQAIAVSPAADGTPTLSTAAVTAPLGGSLGFGSGSPVVTSDGGDPATALVWIVSVAGPAGGGALLLAYPAVPPSSGAWQPVASFPLPTMAKFVQPATDGGTVYVGTRNGQVLAFGAAVERALAAASTDFGQVAAGAGAERDITVTARRAVTVTAAAIGSGGSQAFSLGTPSPALPATLAVGDTLTLPVTFAPSGARTAAGSIALTASGTTSSIGLYGTGTAGGVSASPATLDLGAVAVGQSARNGVVVQNTGTTPTTITATPTLTGSTDIAFTGAVPAEGTVIPAQGTLTLAVTFSPSATESAGSTLTVATSTGTVTVPVRATGYSGQPILALTTPALDFGNIAPGGTGGQAFQVINDGTSTMEITKAAVPAAPFTVPQPIAEGQTVEPNKTVYAQVFVHPITAMPRTDTYLVSVGATAGGTAPPAGNSPQHVTLTVNTHPWSGRIVGKVACVAVSGTPRVGAPVVDGSCTASAANTFTRTAGGYYRLGSSTSPWCVQVHGASTRAGAQAELGRCVASSRARGQTWQLSSRGGFVDVHSGLCLRPTGGTTRAGARLDLERCATGYTTERWDATALLSQRGALSSGLGAAGVRCLTDRNGSRTAGTPVQLSACTFGASQTIAHVGNTLRVAGGCIGAAGTKNGSAVTYTPCSGASAQSWTSDSAGRLVNTAGRLCLDATGGTAATVSTRVLTCTTSAAQRWTLPDAPQAR